MSGADDRSYLYQDGIEIVGFADPDDGALLQLIERWQVAAEQDSRGALAAFALMQKVVEFEAGHIAQVVVEQEELWRLRGLGDDLERSPTRRCLQYAVALFREQICQQFELAVVVVNDQNGRPGLPGDGSFRWVLDAQACLCTAHSNLPSALDARCAGCLALAGLRRHYQRVA
jgi:GNAT superfamily N-acetyltransferase